VFGLGGTEMGVIFLIILLVFGPSQIPKMARAMGEAMREFRKAQHEVHDEINRAADTDDKKQPTSKPVD
jgi:sec-independent protein translocase protein TatA